MRCVEPKHQFHVGQLVDFYSRVRRDENGCWIWQGSRTRDGYGRYFVHGREVRAHVYAWEYENILISPGLFVCHRCDMPPCVNPKHLFLSTHRGNMADMVAKGRQARGARHPQARIRPDVAYLAIKERLEGLPVSLITLLYALSPSSLRTLLRGEHWLQQSEQRIGERRIDLRNIEVWGRIDSLELDRRLDPDLRQIRFRLQPSPADPLEDKRQPLAIHCRGVVADAWFGRLELLAGDRREIAVKGKLSAYSGTQPGTGRRPSFEIALTHIWLHPGGAGSTGADA